MDQITTSIETLIGRAVAPELPNVLSCVDSLCEDKDVVSGVLLSTACKFDEDNYVTFEYKPEESAESIFLQVSPLSRINVCNDTAYDNENDIEMDPKTPLQEYWYLSPSTKKIFNIDPINQELLQVADADEALLDTSNDPVLESLRVEAEKYRKNHYPSGSVEVFYVEQDVEGDQSYGNSKTYVITVGAIVKDEKNLRSGAWSSKFDVSFIEENGENQAIVEGAVRAASHLYEAGNVLAQLNKRFKQTIQFENSILSDPVNTASTILLAINQSETQYYNNVIANYENLKRRFKAVRRQLPFSGTKVDWESRSMGRNLM